MNMKGVSKTLGESPLFVDATLSLTEGQIIGIVGSNGAGKSTLLAIIAQRLEPDSGTISLRRGLEVATLEQQIRYSEGATVASFLLEGIGRRVATLNTYTSVLERNHTQEELTAALEAMELHLGWTLEVDYASLLGELGFAGSHDQRMDKLSGGMQKRIALARLFAAKADLLLLDEPTNHLDIPTIEWLQQQLKSSGSTVVAVTHDRLFLDEACDMIAEQQIFDAIDRASFSKMSLLKEEYEWVERRLGRVPTMVDFLALGGISPLLFIESKGSYLNFLIAMGRMNSGAVTALHLMSLALLGSITAEGKRIQEIHLLALVLERGSITTEEYSASCEMVYGCIPSKRSIDSAIRILTNGFFVGAARLRYGNVSYLVIQDGRIKRSDQFNDLLANDLYRHELSDLLEVGRLHFLHEYQIDRREDDLVIGQKYSRRDICRLLGWERDETSTLYGYKVHYELNLCPILVNYHKDEERINPLNLYRDKFLSPELLVWESRPNRTLDSKEIKAIGQPHIKKLLFVKKSDDEGRDHYFLGEMETLRVAPTSKYDESGTRHSYMMMLFRLTQPVEDGLYRYIIEADEQQKGAFQPA
jgi:ABC-type multidrug transport system ATPase subunit